MSNRTDTIRKGTEVEWDWGNGTAAGKVTDRFEQKVSRSLQGSEITRNGSPDNPALLIEQDDGAEVLKLKSEVRRAS